MRTISGIHAAPHPAHGGVINYLRARVAAAAARSRIDANVCDVLFNNRQWSWPFLTDPAQCIQLLTQNILTISTLSILTIFPIQIPQICPLVTASPGHQWTQAYALINTLRLFPTGASHQDGESADEGRAGVQQSRSSPATNPSPTNELQRGSAEVGY